VSSIKHISSPIQLNASGTKIGIQCELGVTWSSHAPSMNGRASARLPLSHSFNGQTCHSIVILQFVLSGLFLLMLGAAEIRSFSCRVLAAAAIE